MNGPHPSSPEPATPPPRPTGTFASYIHNIRDPPRSAPPPATSRSTPEYTPEQENQAKAILRCRTLFQVLGVERGVDEADLRRSYRRLALSFHPDKCRAPSANAAFQRISAAYDTLSDTAKRLAYEWELDHPDGGGGGGGGGGGQRGPASSHEGFRSETAKDFSSRDAEARATDGVRLFGVTQGQPFASPPAEWWVAEEAAAWQQAAFVAWHVALVLSLLAMLLGRAGLAWAVRQWRDFSSAEYVCFSVHSIMIEFWVTVGGKRYAAFNNVVREIDDNEFMHILMDIEKLVSIMREHEDLHRQHGSHQRTRRGRADPDPAARKASRQQKRKMEREAQGGAKKKKSKRKGRRI